jgi:hypothetical protein
VIVITRPDIQGLAGLPAIRVRGANHPRPPDHFSGKSPMGTELVHLCVKNLDL